MPVCVTCKQEKDESQFWWRWKSKGIRQKVCKDCRSIELSNWYKKHHEDHRGNVARRLATNRQKAREFIWDYLAAHPCTQCGEVDPVVLEFHHIEEKEDSVSRLVAQGASIARLQAEIDRCVVLCANCHRRITAQERGWFHK